MGNVGITDIFSKLLSDEEFKNEYLLAFLDRFVYSTTDLEKELDSEKRKKAIESLLEAYNFLMEHSDGKLSPYDLVNVGDAVNRETGIEGFRRIVVSAGHLAKWTPVAPSSIYYSLYSLFDNYYNVWCARDVYEKEAAFHIKLMRIHPFEDGNKRAAKIIMNANFVKQNYPPVVITEGETELYYEFINNEDVVGFAKFLKSKSLQELSTMMSYYKVAKKIPITDSVIETMTNEGSGGRV